MTVAVFKEHLTLCCTDIDKIVVLTEKICSLKVQEAVRFNSHPDPQDETTGERNDTTIPKRIFRPLSKQFSRIFPGEFSE